MIGTVLKNRYELTQLLLEGPIFSLYAGKDRSSGREVSIRVIKAPYAQEPEFLASLKEAVRRAQIVSNPQVEKLQDLEDDGPAPFIAGELSRGSTMAERIRKLAPYSVPVSVAMATSLLQGLEALHRVGIIHGDVNTNNVVIQPDGNARVQLGGIWPAYSSSATAGAVVLPTMAPYLSPEISAGGMPSASSDVYAVGVILFQLLTGRQPYLGDTPVAVAMKHATQPTPSVRSLNPSVPGALDEVIKKAMAKDPAERYANAGDMLSDLRVIEDAVRFGRPVTWPLKKTGQLPPESALATEPENPRVRGPVAPKMSAVRDPEQQRPVEREERDVPVWMMVTFAGVVGIAACLVGIWLYFNISAPRLVTVPQIQGLTSAEARNMLNNLGLTMRVGAKQSSERMPADAILDSNPGAGEKVREGGTVTVKVSSGSKFVEVPDLRGRTVDAAKSLLSSLDLELDDRVEQIRSFTAKEGTIVRQRPEPRLKVDRFTRIHVAISGGRGTSAPAADDEDLKRYTYTLTVKLTRLEQPVMLRVDITDSRGTRTVYEKRHEPEEEVSIEAVGYGPKAVARIFYNDDLVKQVDLDAKMATQGSGEPKPEEGEAKPPEEQPEEPPLQEEPPR